MPTKNLTLGLALVCASTALAHHREHHVHKTSTGAHGYAIRNGDNDWAIAHKHGISVAKLHRANPDVNWDHLQVGIHIHVPGPSEEPSTYHAESHSAKHVAQPTHHNFSPGLYAIRDGDNDWILAHRAGITIHELKAMNPDVKWDRIHPGQHIHLPGSSISVVSAHRIHTRYAKIASESVRIRRAQGVHAAVITTVDSGTLAKVLDHDGNWYRLRFPKGTEGWVRADFLASAETPEHFGRRSRHSRHSSYVTRRHRRRHHGNTGEYIASNDIPNTELMHKAFSMKGTPYVWGGTSRSGMDCSGFVKRVYQSQGVTLPRTSREQASVGQKVSRDNLKAGDILLFHTGRGSRVTHAAIYVGKGKFIHSSSSGGRVQVNSLNEPYYDHRLVTARRVKK